MDEDHDDCHHNCKGANEEMGLLLSFYDGLMRSYDKSVLLSHSLFKVNYM